MNALSATDAFLAAIEAEHAAIFGYGVAGARMDRDGQVAAREAEAAHRDRRDALVTRVAAAGATPPPAAAAYGLPFPVTDRPSALRLAVALEDGTAAVWRQTLSATAGEERRLAIDALTDCAVRATRWRLAADITPATVPFPGSAS
jgi:hypothetical protein